MKIEFEINEELEECAKKAMGVSLDADAETMSEAVRNSMALTSVQPDLQQMDQEHVGRRGQYAEAKLKRLLAKEGEYADIERIAAEGV